jgi:hypothetical protein
MTSYSTVQGSSSIVDAIQRNYQCCGQNSWLDWGPVNLGGSDAAGSSSGVSTGTGIITGTSVGTGTGTSVGTGTGTSVGKDRSYIRIGNTILNLPSFVLVTGRRRRHLPLQSSPLIRAVRQRRQTGTSSNIYGLPSSYGFALPASCCINGAQAEVNSLATCKYLSID